MADSDLLTYTSKVDALVDRIDAMLELQGGGGTRVNQTVGMGGFATGICISACVCALFFSVACAIFESRSYLKIELEVEQLKAWNDVTRANIAKLQAGQEKH